MGLPTLRPALLAFVLIAAACGSGTASGPSPTPTGPPKTLADLRLAVLDAVGGRLDYCDPDLFPIQRGDPVSNARDRLPMIEADTAAFDAILRHEGLTSGRNFTDEELVAINEDFKQMEAIELQDTGTLYRFSVLVPKGDSDSGNERVTGTVSRAGEVTIESREPGERPSCPICLAIDTSIATPAGDMPVQEVRVGTRVWTTDLRGRRIVGVVLATGRSAAPPGHEMVRLTLADGRTVAVSPGHPTADGRRAGDLRTGDTYDGSHVAAAERLPYTGGFTYDLLPSGPTGSYFADGVLLGSTLE